MSADAAGSSLGPMVAGFVVATVTAVGVGLLLGDDPGEAVVTGVPIGIAVTAVYYWRRRRS